MEKYRQIKVLGKGSFGAAWLIQRKGDNEQLVAKEICLPGLKPHERESAKHEITILRRLRHPNITRYVDHFEHRGSLFIVMEYANGGDMYMKIKERRGRLMSEQEVLHYFTQLCLALNYLHENRVLHRDLKTQNVFLTRDGIVKLGDFGISTMLHNTCELKRTVCGTPYYFSPELCMNKPYNNKSDVWALGCVLYEMTTLNHAFDGTNMKALVQKILKGVYPAINTIYSRELSNIISAMLDSDPSQRPNVSKILQLPFLRGALASLQQQLHVAQKLRTAVLPVAEKSRQHEDVAKWPAESHGQDQLDALKQAELQQQQRNIEERKQQLMERQREVQRAQEQALQERRRQLEDRVRTQRRLQAERIKLQEGKLQKLEAQWDRNMQVQGVENDNRRTEAPPQQLSSPRAGANHPCPQQQNAAELYLEMRKQALLNKQRVQAIENGYSFPILKQNAGVVAKADAAPTTPKFGPSSPPVAGHHGVPQRAAAQDKLEEARAAAFWQMRCEAEQNRRRVLGLAPVDVQPNGNNLHPSNASPHARGQESKVAHPCTPPASPRNQNRFPVRKKGGDISGERKDQARSPLNVVPSFNASPPTPPWLLSPTYTHTAAYSLLKPAPDAGADEGFCALIDGEAAVVEEDQAHKEKQRDEDYSDLDTIIAQALIEATTPTKQAMQDFDDNATPKEDDAAPTTTGFMLEGKTLQLPHVRASDPLVCRIEALRIYLEEKLGEKNLLTCYNTMNGIRGEDDAMQRIAEVLPQEKQRYISLVAQLIVCEDVFNRQGGTL